MAGSSITFDFQAEYGQGVIVDEHGRFFSGCAGSNRARQDWNELLEHQRTCALRICEETCDRLGVGCLRERAIAIMERLVSACRISRLLELLECAAHRQRLFVSISALRRAEPSLDSDEEGDTEDGEDLENVEGVSQKHRGKLRLQIQILRDRIIEKLRRGAAALARRRRQADKGKAMVSEDSSDHSDGHSGEEDEEAEADGLVSTAESYGATWPVPTQGIGSDILGTSLHGQVLLFPMTEEQVRRRMPAPNGGSVCLIEAGTSRSVSFFVSFLHLCLGPCLVLCGQLRGWESRSRSKDW